jgi:hypothetical protein
MNTPHLTITIGDSTRIGPVTVTLTANTVGGVKALAKAVESMAAQEQVTHQLSPMMIMGATQEQVGLALQRVLDKAKRAQGHLT